MFWRHVIASLYPWDMLDEGLEPMLDRLQNLARVNAVYLVALMHDEKRPLTDFYYPHNPRRKVYWTEDSRAYWNPDPSTYAGGRITPRLSDKPELQGRDWLQELVKGARARGMAAGAELSHTWIDKERMGGALADCVQRDIYGQPFDQQICFNHPNVQAYGVALYRDLASHYELDFVQTCVRGFNPGRKQPWTASDADELTRLIGVTLGGCFCEHCERDARARGVDWSGMVEALRWLADGHDRYHHRAHFELRLLTESSMTATALLGELPELHAFMQFRIDSLTAFYQLIYDQVHAVRPDIDVRLNHYAAYPELMGLSIRKVNPYIDSVRSSDYSEQTGDVRRMDWKRAYLHGIRRAIGPDKYFVSAISPRPRATPELVKHGILVSAQCGADGLTIGHYDGAWLDCLRAIGEGLDEASIVIDREAEVANGAFDAAKQDAPWR